MLARTIFRIPVMTIMSSISTPKRWGNRVNNRLDYRARSFNLFHTLRVEIIGKRAIHARVRKWGGGCALLNVFIDMRITFLVGRRRNFTPWFICESEATSKDFRGWKKNSAIVLYSAMRRSVSFLPVLPRYRFCKNAVIRHCGLTACKPDRENLQASREGILFHGPRHYASIKYPFSLASSKFSRKIPTVIYARRCWSRDVERGRNVNRKT